LSGGGVLTVTEIDELLPEGETLRINEWEAALTLLIGGFAALLGGVTLTEVPGAHEGGSVPWELLSGLAFVVAGVLVGLGVRTGLTVEGDWLTVRGIIRTRKWRWEEIAKFELAPFWYLPDLRITLLDGRRVRTPGSKCRSGRQRELAEQRVAEMNRRLSVKPPRR
jgi:hypothetical protein